MATAVAGTQSDAVIVGLLDEVLATGAPPLTCEYSYVDGGADPTVDPPQEPAEFGHCLSVRRQTLDPLLATRVASTPGVNWLNHRRVVKLIGSNPVRGVLDADGAEHHASVIIGADGRRSTVARLVAASKELEHPAARLLLYRDVSGYTHAKAEPGPEFSLLGNEVAYAFPSDHLHCADGADRCLPGSPSESAGLLRHPPR